MFLAKEAAREQLLKEVPENLLTKICLSNNSNAIRWEEEDKEFSLDGEMYDVVKLKNENGEKYALCLNDENEDRVIAALEKVVQSNLDNSQNSGKHHSASKVVMFEWLSDQQLHGQSEESIGYAKKEYFSYKSSLCYNFKKINSPPPDFYYKLNRKT